MISVVIPVWNEDPRNLRALSTRLQPVLNRLAKAWEVLFVDDGSDAVTKRTLQALAAEDPHVRLVCLERRHGQEAALVAGLLAARGEFICTIDCDLESLPEEIPNILAPLMRGYDLVLGKRRERPGVSMVRRIASRVFNKAMNLRWGTRISDWGCGLNAGRRIVFEVFRDRFGEWAEGSLKRSFIGRANRWIEVEVTQDIRRHRRSGYSWPQLCWRGLRALIWGDVVILPSPKTRERSQAKRDGRALTCAQDGGRKP